MVKKFRQYEWKGETIVVEEVGKVKFFWYKVVDLVEPVFNTIKLILDQWGMTLSLVLSLILLGLTLLNYHTAAGAVFFLWLGIFSYAMIDLLISIKKAFRSKP